MGRNKLSADDKIKIQCDKPVELLGQLEVGNPIPLMKYLRTIRSKALRSLCLFALNYFDIYNFMVDYSPKELSQQLGIGERKVYDLIKTLRFIGAVEDVGFDKIFSSEAIKK